MELISSDLEQRLLALIKQNKLLEAVALIHNELKLDLKESKEIVDSYRSMNKGE